MHQVEHQQADARKWRVVVQSIGLAGAGIVSALRQVLPLAEEQLAARLYRAPAELIGPLDRATAEGVSQVLQQAGLEVAIVGKDEPFDGGQPDYDVALVVKDLNRLVEITREIALFLGVPLNQAQQILYACPMELVGRVSANTVAALRRRFEPLGVELDVSRPTEALFDIYLGNCPLHQRELVWRHLRGAGVTPAQADYRQESGPLLLCAGLSKADAEALWQRLKAVTAPLRVINRDFQRFDLRLDQAPQNPAMVQFLVATTGMPERVANQVPGRTPIFTHHNIRYQEANALLQDIVRLGGRASRHLLAFQSFRLHLAKVGDIKSAVRLLEVLGGLEPVQAHETVRTKGTTAHPTPTLQARWLQHELKRVGTDARMVLV